jgi:hypothetical protein
MKAVAVMMRLTSVAVLSLMLLAGCFRNTGEVYRVDVSTGFSQPTPTVSLMPVMTLEVPNPDGMTLLDVNPNDGDADDLRLFIFRQELVMLVADDHHVQVRGFAIGNDRLTYNFVDLFPVIAEIDGVLPRDTCFIISVPVPRVTPPTVCAGKPIFRAQVTLEERFWYDASNDALDIVRVYTD